LLDLAGDDVHRCSLLIQVNEKLAADNRIGCPRGTSARLA
jgi:hypothetical protein